MKKKQNVENGTSIHFYYANTHLRQPSDFLAIHQTMGWQNTTRTLSERKIHACVILVNVEFLLPLQNIAMLGAMRCQ